jgi:NAD(P)-dependent dehydrogenase (short-subunit alcohol dehydrogenase family)
MTARVVVVTGGESGIGRATAVRLARAGWCVTVGDVHPMAENDGLYSELAITRRTCDVRHEADLKRLIETAVHHGTRLDGLINNAGIGMVKPITAVTEEDWDRCLDTNLKGAFFGCKQAIPHLIAAGGGAIVNVASNAGLLPRAHDPVYSISKHALVGLTKALALCHAPDRIRINAVCPGPVGETGMMNADLDQAADRAAAEAAIIAASPIAQAFQRMITPDEVATAIEYLLSDAAVMVTGTLLAIDGGKSLGVPPRR